MLEESTHKKKKKNVVTESYVLQYTRRSTKCEIMSLLITSDGFRCLMLTLQSSLTLRHKSTVNLESHIIFKLIGEKVNTDHIIQIYNITNFFISSGFLPRDRASDIPFSTAITKLLSCPWKPKSEAILKPPIFRPKGNANNHNNKVFTPKSNCQWNQNDDRPSPTLCDGCSQAVGHMA